LPSAVTAAQANGTVADAELEAEAAEAEAEVGAKA